IRALPDLCRGIRSGRLSATGLLRKLGNHGILVIKDVTSILSADRHTRGPVLAALREVYDGRWERNVGSDGGLTLTWIGRLVIVGAVTTAWDTAHSVIAASCPNHCSVASAISRPTHDSHRAPNCHQNYRHEQPNASVADQCGACQRRQSCEGE